MMMFFSRIALRTTASFRCRFQQQQIRHSSRTSKQAAIEDHADTIVQLSSGLGTNASPVGIAVLRMSGPLALPALARLLPLNLPPLRHRQAVVRPLLDRTNEQQQQHRMIDSKAIVTYFQAPRSYTGEDVVEISTHGNRLVVEDVLSTLQAVAGVRLAGPGEFTKRAFLHGKLDLTQVEALGDLLNAETELQKQQALHQLDGHLGALYLSWRRELVQSLAYLEAVIDFAEDEADVGEESILKDVLPRVSDVVQSVEAHLNDGHRGELVRDGVRVCIAGPPNVGKSTLLNLLSKRDVAIVSDVPGTTRDALEVHVDVSGLAVILTDTAGLRDDHNDAIEQEGMKRTLQHLQQADVKVFMVDVTQMEWLREQEVDEKTIVVLSKTDLLSDQLDITNTVRTLSTMTQSSSSSSSMDPTSPLAISCATQSNIDDLLSRIKHVAMGTQTGSSSSNRTVLTRQRHRECVLESHEYLQAFQDNVSRGCFDLVLGAEQLRQAAGHLGRITGHVDVEELLDVIFRDFCIGK